MNFTSPKDAMDHGFALITEERKANGSVPERRYYI